MQRMEKAVLTGVVIAVVFTPACHKQFKTHAPGNHYGQEDQRRFDVYIYTDPNDATKCLADWPVGTIWFTKHQSVMWFSDDGKQYTIDFNAGTHNPPPKTPFQNLTYTVNANGTKPSGPVQQGASGYYDFAIHAGDINGPICKDASDPGYYVKP